MRERLKRLKCGILIPTYNNIGAIEGVVNDALNVCDDVWVVNDGSTDQTFEFFSHKEGIHFLSYPDNQGKGVALKTGFADMVNCGMEYAITVDADGQHKISDIPLLVEQAEKNAGAIIAGTRNVKNQEGMPGKNSFANQFSNFWFKVETGMDFPDTQCGIRIYPIKRLADTHFFSTKYEFELEVLVRSVWKGIPLIAQPVHVYYPPAEERVSHFRPFQDFSRISVLNTILVLVALLYIKPRDFFRNLTWTNIKRYFRENVSETEETPAQIAKAAGLGTMFGILPIWGYQIIAELAVAHLLKINKVITVIFSNISSPPCIPFILWGSYALGGLLLGGDTSLPSPKEIDLNYAWSLGKQYVIGAIVLAIISGITVGLATYFIVKHSREKKEAKK